MKFKMLNALETQRLVTLRGLKIASHGFSDGKTLNKFGAFDWKSQKLNVRMESSQSIIKANSQDQSVKDASKRYWLITEC